METTRAIGHAFVPVDDENCMVWCFTHHPSRPLSAHELGHAQRRLHPCQSHPRLVPPGGQQGQRLHDRPRVKGIAMQDAAI